MPTKTTVRLDGYEALIAALKAKTGIRATSELMRLALKEMAERWDVRVESEGK